MFICRRRQAIVARRFSTASDERELVVGVVGAGIAGMACALALQRLQETSGLRLSVRVFEKDAGFWARRQGYGLTLGQANAALRWLGLLSELRRDADIPSTAHYIFERSGQLLGFFGFEFSGDASPQTNAAERERKKAHVHLPRQQLRLAMYQRLRPGTVRWSSSLAAVETLPEQRGLRLHFDGAAHADVSLLVGADGIYSVTRRLLSAATPLHPSVRDSRLNYLGLLVVNGIGPTRRHPLLHRRRFQSLDGQHRLFVMPFTDAEQQRQRRHAIHSSFNHQSLNDHSLLLNDHSSLLNDHSQILNDHSRLLNDHSQILNSSVDHSISQSIDNGNHFFDEEYDTSMWQLSFPCDIEQARHLATDTEALFAELRRRRFADWHEPVPRLLLDDTKPGLVLATPVYDRDPLLLGSLYPAERPLCTLIGDALHPMSPFKGQGANQGIVDAVHLAQAVAAAGSFAPSRLAAALTRFEAEMIARSDPKVAHSRDCAYRFHQPDSVSTRFFADARGIADHMHVVDYCRQHTIGAYPHSVHSLDQTIRSQLFHQKEMN